MTTRSEDVGLLILGFSGVLTDGRTQINRKGKRLYSISDRDVYGLRKLHKIGVDALVLSAQYADLSEAFGMLAGMTWESGVTDKVHHVHNLVEVYAQSSRIAYVGCEEYDLAAMKLVDHVYTPHGSLIHAKVLEMGGTIIPDRYPPGHSAVRWVCDEICHARERAEASEAARGRRRTSLLTEGRKK